MTALSFALPKYTSAMERLYREIADGLRKHDELLGQIQSQAVSHSGSTRQVTEPVVVETKLQRFQAMFEIKIDAFLQTDAEQFATSITAMIESLLSQQKRLLFEVLGQTTEAVGNVIDAKGRNPWEAYIEMLETTEIQFDETGQHNYKVYMHPTTAQKLEQNPPSPEQLRRMEEVMETKRKNFYARKRSRRLRE